MDFVDLIALFGLNIIIYAALKLKRKRRQRRYKIRPINRGRSTRDAGLGYYKKMKTWDLPQFFKYTRMTVPVFEKLLSKIKSQITKQKRQDGIVAEERLIITLQ